MSTDIIVPPLSQTSDILVFREWLKKPGEKVEKGQALFTVETDKATLEVEAPVSGILFEISAKPNTEINVRSVIGKILHEGEEPPNRITNGQEATQPEIQTERSSGQNEIDENNSKYEKRYFSSPRARRLAQQNGVDLTQAKPSGLRGMIVERDIKNHINEFQIDSEKTVPFNHIRKVIAERMMASHLGSAPVSYMVEADATNLVNIHELELAHLEKDAIRLTYTDFFIHILCLALQRQPQFNATVKNDQLEIHNNINLALAVDTDRGLIVPVMRDANQLSLHEIAEKRKDLVMKAVMDQCDPRDLSGGTFTLTNLGTIGIDYFTPIINPPQIAILGIGRIREAPAVKDGGLFFCNKVSLSLTCDHRFIDGAPAAKFLNTLVNIVESYGCNNNL